LCLRLLIYTEFTRFKKLVCSVHLHYAVRRYTLFWSRAKVATSLTKIKCEWTKIDWRYILTHKFKTSWTNIFMSICWTMLWNKLIKARNTTIIYYYYHSLKSFVCNNNCKNNIFIRDKKQAPLCSLLQSDGR
jgi:hypothetical protein